MPQQQTVKAGGKHKQKRSAKHKSMYAAQFYRTARNKANAAARIRRRKEEKPYGYKHQLVKGQTND